MQELYINYTYTMLEKRDKIAVSHRISPVINVHITLRIYEVRVYKHVTALF